MSTKLLIWMAAIVAAITLGLGLMAFGYIPSISPTEPDPSTAAVAAASAPAPATPAKPPTPPAKAATPAPPTAPAVRTDPGWSAVAFRKEAASPVTTLSSIQTAHITNDGIYDQISFHFRGAVPGIAVGYVAGPIHNAAGQVVVLTGTGFLQIQLLQAQLPNAKSPQPSLAATVNRLQLKSFAVNGTGASTISVALGLDHGSDNKSVFRVIESPGATESVIYVDIK